MRGRKWDKVPGATGVLYDAANRIACIELADLFDATSWPESDGERAAAVVVANVAMTITCPEARRMIVHEPTPEQYAAKAAEMERAKVNAETARELRRLRLGAGLSQREIAERLGVCKGTVADWEHGRVRLKRFAVIAWRAVCGNARRLARERAARDARDAYERERRLRESVQRQAEYDARRAQERERRRQGYAEPY